MTRGGGGGKGGAAAAMAESATAGATDAQLPTVRIGLVGCGWFMQRAHIPVLVKLEQGSAVARGFAVRVVAICSRTEASLQRAEKKLQQRARPGPLRQYTDMERLFSDPEVDAVIIALPIPAMAAAVAGALRAGKHVISEKPFAPSLAEAIRLWREE